MEKEQLGEIIIASEDTLYHMAKTILRSDADCKDAIQEAVVKAFTNIHTLRQDTYVKTWLIRILINECYAIQRREKRILTFHEYAKEKESIHTTDYTDLYEAIQMLSQKSRICVTLYYLEGYSIKEIAKLLGITQGAVKKRLARAREKLRAELVQQEHANGRYRPIEGISR